MRERMADGFDIHHLDGNHDNNDPANLVLIEHTDHMALHGGRTLGRLKQRGKKRGPRTVVAPDGTVLVLHRRLLARVAIREHARRAAHAGN